MVHIILACTLNGGIGYKNKIPWSIPEDLQLFKDLTLNKTVVMGRKTWDSLPDKVKPLPHRKNVIISKSNLNSNSKSNSNIFYVDSIESALESYPDGIYIGGAQIYNTLIDKNLVTSANITFVHNSFTCDTFVNIDKLRNRTHNIVDVKKNDVFTHMYITFFTSHF